MFPGKPLRYFLLLSSRERRKTVQFLLLSGDQSLLSPPPSWLQGSVLECIHLPAFTYCSSSHSFPRSHSRTGSPIDAVTPWSECILTNTMCKSSIKGSCAAPSNTPFHQDDQTLSLNFQVRSHTVQEDKCKHKYQITQLFSSCMGRPERGPAPSHLQMSCDCLQLSSSPAVSQSCSGQTVLSSWKDSSILNPTGAPKALKQIFRTQSSGSQAGPVESKEKNLALLRNHKAGLVRGARGTEINPLAEEVLFCFLLSKKPALNLQVASF